MIRNIYQKNCFSFWASIPHPEFQIETKPDIALGYLATDFVHLILCLKKLKHKKHIYMSFILNNKLNNG